MEMKKSRHNSSISKIGISSRKTNQKYQKTSLIIILGKSVTKVALFRVIINKKRNRYNRLEITSFMALAIIGVYQLS